MKDTAAAVDLVSRRTRSGARLLGFLVAGLFLLVLAIEIPEPDGLSIHHAVLLGMCAVSLLGILVAWRRERAGALLIKVGAGVSGLFAWVSTSQGGPIEADMLAFTQLYVGLALLAGLLFLLCNKASQPEQ